MIIEKNSPFKYFENTLQDKIYYPFAWLQEGVIEPSDVSKPFELPVNKHWLYQINISNTSEYLFIIFSLDNSRKDDIFVGTAG